MAPWHVRMLISMHLVRIMLVYLLLVTHNNVFISELNFDIPLSLFRTIISVSEKGPLPTV